MAHPECCAGSLAGSDWKAVNQEPFLSTRYTVPNLSSGDKIHVRVMAVSASGASVPATLEQPVLIREILREYSSWGQNSCVKFVHPRSMSSLSQRPLTDVILSDCVQFPWEKLPDLTNLADVETLGVKDSKGRATFSHFMARAQNLSPPEHISSPWPCHIPNMPRQHWTALFVLLREVKSWLCGAWEL